MSENQPKTVVGSPNFALPTVANQFFLLVIRILIPMALTSQQRRREIYNRHLPPPSSGDNSTGNNVPAGGLCLSKFASFSKIRRPSLGVESLEDDSTLASDSVPPPCRSEEAETDIHSPKIKREVVGAMEIMKKHPNLIGQSNFQSFPVKRPKYGNEGNFVRLNTNGYGSKSKFKGKRNQYSAASGRRYFRGSKRKSKGDGGDGKVESNGGCDEDGSVLKTQQV
ncbi:DNA helicase, partial [Sarracenia purpurea var. burkii]